MKDKLIVHIGLPKTGTTRLQSAFFENQSVLKNAGIFYPTGGSYYSEGGCNQKYLAWDFLPHLPPSGFNTKAAASFSLQRIDKSISDLARDLHADPCPYALLSSEYFFNVAQHPRGLLRLKDFFSSLAREVTIICYIREHLSLMASAYNQAIKVGLKQTPDFERWAQDNCRNYLANGLLTTWAKVFGRENLLVRPYSSNQLIAQDIFRDFIETAGLAIDPSDLLIPRGRANSSISLRTADAIRSINGRIVDPQVRPMVAQILARANILQDQAGEGVMRTKTRDALYFFFEQDRRKIAQNFLNNTFTGHEELGPKYDKHWYGGISQEEMDYAVHILRANLKQRSM